MIPFDVAAPGVDESEHAGEPPAGRAIRLSTEKARAVAAGRTNSLVIGSDQVAALGSILLDKPGGFARAVEQLQMSRNREVVFNTAVTLIDTRSAALQVENVPVTVRFRDYSDAEIERYLHTEAPYDCAGSAKAEGLGITLIEWMRCDDPTAIVGLPLITLSRMLRRAGLTLP